MDAAIIGGYELTRSRDGGPASLVIHNVVQGYDAVSLDAAAAAELGELIAVQQKRIREIGGYRVILGGSGDLTIYDQLGRRACYLTGDQVGQLVGHRERAGPR